MKKFDYKNVIFLVLVLNFFIVPFYYLSMYVLKDNAQPRTSAYELTRSFVGKTVKSIRYDTKVVTFTFEDNSHVELTAYSENYIGVK